jgi:predicted nuclease of predicted toxin-antitoxin system
MFRLDLAELLRSQGHEVLCTFEMGQETADDSAVLGLAIREDRILVTMDEHFGDWATLPLDKHPGVIRVKIHPTTTTNIAGLLSPFLASHRQEEFRDHLVIFSSRGERWICTCED